MSNEEESNLFVIHLKGLPQSVCNAQSIRRLLNDVYIGPGEVHVLGGEHGQAFVNVTSFEEAKKALSHDGRTIDDQKVVVRLSNTDEKLKIIEAFRDEGRPSWAAKAAANFIKQLTLEVAQTKSQANQRAAFETEQVDREEKNLEIDAELLEALKSAKSEPADFAMPNPIMSTMSSEELGEGRVVDTRPAYRAPLLPSPAGAARVSREPSPPPAVLLPLPRGGYWVKCCNIDNSWTAEQFDHLLKEQIRIKSPFWVEKMMGDAAYVGFMENDDFMRFLKCVGYLNDEETPKLDDSVLRGLTAWPCAECSFEFAKLQEQRERRFFNGPGPRKDLMALPIPHPEQFAPRGFRGGRGGRFNGRGRPFHPQGNRAVPLRGRGGLFRNDHQPGNQRGFRGRGRGEGGIKRYHHDRNNQNGNEEMESESEGADRKPPAKRFRSDKHLAFNDLRRKIRTASMSSTEAKGSDKEVEERSHHPADPRPIQRQGYRQNHGQAQYKSPRGHQDTSPRGRHHDNGENYDHTYGRNKPPRRYENRMSPRGHAEGSHKSPRGQRNGGDSFASRKRISSDGTPSDGESTSRKRGIERSNAIRLSGMPYRITTQQINNIVEKETGISYADLDSLHKDQRNDESEAVLVFQNEEDARKAKEYFDGLLFHGRYLSADHLPGK